MSGHDELEAFVRRVEALGKMNAEAAKEAAPDVLEALQKTARAGTSPSGEPWPPKADGGRALGGAAKAIEVTTKGPQVVAHIGPPEGFHNWGAGGSSTTKKAVQARARAARVAAKSGTKSKFHAPRRQILPGPGDPIPPAVNDAMRAAAARVFDRTMGGR